MYLPLRRKQADHDGVCLTSNMSLHTSSPLSTFSLRQARTPVLCMLIDSRQANIESSHRKT